MSDSDRATNKLRAWQQQALQKEQENHRLQLLNKQLTQDVQSLRGQLFAYGILPCAGQSVPPPNNNNSNNNNQLHATPSPFAMAPPMMMGGVGGGGAFPMHVPSSIGGHIGSTNSDQVTTTTPATTTKAPKTLKKPPSSMLLTKEKVKKIFRSPVQAAAHLPATQKPRWQGTLGSNATKEKKDAAAAATAVLPLATVEGALPSSLVVPNAAATIAAVDVATTGNE